MKKVDVELKKLFTKDGVHVGYMITKALFDNKIIDISKAPLFKTQVEANNFLRQMQEELNKKFTHPFDKIKEDPFKERKHTTRSFIEEILGYKH